MKKVLSCLLCAAMLAASAATAVIAADEPVIDRAMLLDDISIPDSNSTGGLGYIVNDESVVKDPNGVSVAFDFNAISATPCSHLVSEIDTTWRHQSALTFTFSNYEGYQAVIYDVIRQEFQIANIGFPRSGINPNMGHVVALKKYEMKPGDWHRLFYSLQGTEIKVFVDGEEILSHDFSGGKNGNVTHSFLMFWPSHIRCMIDNMVVGNDLFVDGDTSDENKANILFESDFNDAVAPVYDHTVKDVPTWEIKKDQYGKDMEDENGNPIYVQDTDENGKPLTNEDGTPKWKQAVNDKGEPLTHDEDYYKVGNEVVKGGSQQHAGFSFQTFGQSIPYKGVDKATYSGMIKESDKAVLSVEDTLGTEGQTFTAAINYNSANGAFASAKNLVLAYDPIFDSAKIENVAAGAKVELHDGNLVDITVPANFEGKLADLVLTVPKENEMAQSDSYRYGFMIGANTVFADASGAAIDKNTVAIDGAQANTKNFILGDANGDGSVNAKDVAIIMYYMAHQKDADVATNPKLANFNRKAANVYADTEAINARDISVLMKTILEKPITSK